MRTITLKLEAIADHLADQVKQIRRGMAPNRIPRRFESMLYAPVRQPWVSELTQWRGGERYGREFLRGQKDFSQANSIGSRGVYFYYHLQEGRYYEVRELLTWKRDRRYFCTVRGGAVVELTTDEVQSALSERAEREAGLV